MKRKDQAYINMVRRSIDEAKQLERNLYIEAVAKKTARTVKIAFITITTIIIILSLLA
jgi:hypothetical protein